MKAYVKPELFYERYELSQHIADCTFEVTYLEDNTNCVGVGDADKMPGFTLFTAEPTCNWLPEWSGNDYCYMGSVTSKTTFIS